jgi:hypothetical protein
VLPVPLLGFQQRLHVRAVDFSYKQPNYNSLQKPSPFLKLVNGGEFRNSSSFQLIINPLYGTLPRQRTHECILQHPRCRLHHRRIPTVHAASPSTKLYLNEYDLEYGGAEYNALVK